MNCQDAQELISGLVDDELTIEERRTIDAHMTECRNCQLTYKDEIVLKQHLHAAGASLTVPADLREKILALGKTGGPEPADEGGQVKTWLPFSGFRPAVALGALVVVLTLIYFWWPTQNISIAALETHQKVLSRKITFLQAQNAAELKQQMMFAVEGRFAPMGYDFSAMKIFPVGGLVQDYGDKKILGIFYQGEGPEITCFTFIGTENDIPKEATHFFDVDKRIDFYTFSRGEVNGVLHREGEVICILVSKLPLANLLEIARAKANRA